MTELIKVSASVEMEYLKIILNTTQTHSAYRCIVIRDYNHKCVMSLSICEYVSICE